jgi:large subunit ribosomal protein L5
MKQKEPITKAKYKKILSELGDALGEGNVHALPKITKVTVNVGTGKFLKEQSRVDEIIETLALITGQKPVMTKARKAIAGFKIREGLEVGAKVTLRGRRMWQFLDRLLNATLPRVRDFQGLPKSVVGRDGNASIGIREQLIFPEIVPEKVGTPFSLQVVVTTTAGDEKRGVELFRLLGFPIRKE